jgi:hypothetical protein
VPGAALLFISWRKKPVLKLERWQHFRTPLNPKSAEIDALLGRFLLFLGILHICDPFPLA